MKRKSFVLLLSVSLILSLAACDAIELPIRSTTTEGSATSTIAPEPTDAPEPTEAPQPSDTPEPTEAPPETGPPATEAPSDEESGVNIGLILGLLLLAMLLVGILIGRSRRRSTSATASLAAPPPVAEKKRFVDFARDGYSEARWLLDAFSDELAIWRGNALYEGTIAIGDSAGTALATTWAQLDERMNKATDQLYRAEAAAPDQSTISTVRVTITALRATRSALDARAEARLNTRRAEGQSDLAEAGERERLASSAFAENKQNLSDSLLALSALL